MKKSIKNSGHLMLIASFGLLILTVSTGCKTTNSKSVSSAAGSRLAREMIGTWMHVGAPGRIMEPPAKGGRFKSRTGTHWILTTADADTGLVREVFGGTYTMNGDQYVETQTFANETWLHDNGQSFRFIVTVEGDTMTQIGVGNPYTEVWKRVK